MTRFRPCIDLHQGLVKQIVGSTLRDDNSPIENFSSSHNSAYYAHLFREKNLTGAHVIQLGPGNETAAREALAAWPNALQIGGGIHAKNAQSWLDAGASHVIVTSTLFNETGEFLTQRLEQLANLITPEKLVIDLSCRRTQHGWIVAMNRWQTLTNLTLNHQTLDQLAPFCAEFLIHAADVEGLCQGIDTDLVSSLGTWTNRPLTYAGGAATLTDLETIDRLSHGNMDVTVGSALDIFGGKTLRFNDLVTWNQRT